MKIAIRSERWKLVIHVPLRVLRMKCIGRWFVKSWKREHGASVDPDVLAAILPHLYTCLKDWKKQHGSLMLVEWHHHNIRTFMNRKVHKCDVAGRTSRLNRTEIGDVVKTETRVRVIL